MDGRASDHQTRTFEAFAAAVAHELRTPLAALSGEVELALRRERSPAEYREALSRIAVSIAELVDLTGDLTFLGQTSDASAMRGVAARVDAMLAHVAERSRAKAGDVHVVETVATDAVVVGAEGPLVHALTLVIEHAVRHRRDGSHVRLRVAAPEDATSGADAIDLLLEAPPDGFWPHAWPFLAASEADAGGTREPPAPPLRLRTAERIVRECGGSLQTLTVDGQQAVRIRLRRAEAA